MFKKLFNLILVFVLTFVLVSHTISYAETSNDTTNKTVETFTIETYSDTKNEQGIYELTGYKEVNSITSITKSIDTISTKIESIEDYYDINGEFIETIVYKSEFENNLLTGKAKSKDSREISKNPLVVKNSSESIVEDNVIKHVKKLKDKPYKDVQGFTLKQIEEIKEKARDISIKINKENPTGIKIMAAEAAGAFDNYYNHDTSTGSFVAQALSQTAHKYIKITGSTYGSTKNANSLASFKSNINNYEYYIINEMNYDDWAEKFAWFSALMGLVTLVIGFATGPAGWVAIVQQYAGALGTFAGLTSTIYATNYSLQLSKNAAQNVENARAIVNNSSSFENYSVQLVSGY